MYISAVKSSSISLSIALIKNVDKTACKPEPVFNARTVAFLFKNTELQPVFKGIEFEFNLEQLCHFDSTCSIDFRFIHNFQEP